MDVHFLIDNAPPEEVRLTLQCLEKGRGLTNDQLSSLLFDRWDKRAQRNYGLSTRRLADLNLADRRQSNSGVSYMLTDRGERVRNLLVAEPDLYADIMHYLHYDGYDGLAETRKLLWTYRRCSDLVWDRGCVLPHADIVSHVLAGIQVEFPDLYGQKVGGNFNVGGVTSWKPWIRELSPSPVDEQTSLLTPRRITRYELALLAADHVYRRRDQQYGTPVVLDGTFLDETSRVFFLDTSCCRELLELAARLERTVTFRSTFAGPSLTLAEPYGIERL